MPGIVLTALPDVQTGIVTLPPKNLTISNTIPIPTVASDGVLVKTAAIALNHSDYKMVDFFPCPGAIAGSDFAGTVIGVGEHAASRFDIGDRVAGAVQGSNHLDHQDGAFAQYVTQSADFMWKIPAAMSFEEGASIGGAVYGTIVLALFKSLGLAGTPDVPVTKNIIVLVYGGSSACGTMALQMLKLCGYNPITTCSSKNFALVKTFGAAEAFDYASPKCDVEIRNYCKGSLYYALDTITDARSLVVCCSAIGRAGGKYTSLDQLPDETGLRRTIKRDWVMGPAISGNEIKLPGGYAREASKENRAFGVEWFRVLQKLVEEGKLKNHPLKIGANGFDGVLKGLEALKSKQLSAMKSTHRIE